MDKRSLRDSSFALMRRVERQQTARINSEKISLENGKKMLGMSDFGVKISEFVPKEHTRMNLYHKRMGR